MILGISGKYESAKFNQLIKTHWQKRPKRKFGGWAKIKDKQSSPRMKLQFKQTEQSHLSLGFKGFAYGDKRNAAQSVLSAILGGGMSSRLFMEVRERRGLGYYIRASGGSYQDTGVFNIGSGVRVEKIQEALAVIMGELKKIKTASVGDKELQKAKDYIKGKTILALEDNQVRLDWFLEHAAFYRKIETPDEVFKKIDGVTSDDIKKVAKDLFQNKNMTLAIIGPYKTESQFKKILDV
jgi:predicted Zn-dependent peptidase